MTKQQYLVAGLLITVVAGCGSGGHPDTATVTGVVTYGGRPLDGVRVIFNTQNTPRSASATTEADGSFTLSTYRQGDGAVPGSYIVTVERFLADSPDVSAEESFKSMEGEAYTQAMLSAATGNKKTGEHNDFPAKYSDLKKSGLLYEVKAGEKNHFEITLK